MDLGRRELISILFKHWRLLSILFAVVFLVCTAGSFLITDTYKAETQLLVQSGREFAVATLRGDQLPTGVPQITKQEIINSEVELLSGRDLAERVVKAIGIKRMYPGLEDDGLLVTFHILDPDTQAERMDAAVKQFMKKVKIEPVTMSNVINISYWNADRDIAIEALRQLTAIYAERHAEIFGNRGSGVLGQQTSEYERQLVDVTQKITSLKNREHLSDIAYEREQLIQDRSDVESKLRDLKTQAIDAQRTLEYFQNNLKSMPEMVLTTRNSADAIETAKSRLLDLNTQLVQMKQRYTDTNPNAVAPMKDLEDQISAIKAFIADPTVNEQNALGRNLTYDDGRMKLQGAAAALPALQQKIAFETLEDEKILDRLQALDDGDAKLEVMNREQGTLRELVHDYRDRYEEARMAGDMDKKNVISVSVVHQPESELKPDKPKHVVFAAVGFVGGLMAIAVALLYFLVFRESIITTESLERTLKLRVLGAVPNVA